MTPKEYIVYINNKYTEARKERISRFDLSWGMWSRRMNLEIRKLIELGNEDSIWYKHVFAYWIAISQLLEMYFKRQHLYKWGKIRELKEEAKVLKQGIIDKVQFVDTFNEKTFLELAVELTEEGDNANNK